jgi:hypothetical protein
MAEIGQAQFCCHTELTACDGKRLIDPREAAVDDNQIGTVTGQQPRYDAFCKLVRVPVLFACDDDADSGILAAK